MVFVIYLIKCLEIEKLFKHKAKLRSYYGYTADSYYMLQVAQKKYLGVSIAG